MRRPVAVRRVAGEPAARLGAFIEASL